MIFYIAKRTHPELVNGKLLRDASMLSKIQSGNKVGTYIRRGARKSGKPN
jgi:hypothetical protein